MRNISSVCIIFVIILCSNVSSAQKIPLYTQYFTNPYIYNPAYAGLEGRSVFTLTHRRQWVGITDAPVTSNFVYHTALKGGVNLGVNVTQDEAGIFKTSSGLLTFGYTVGLGWNHFLSFGISGGAAFNSIDLSSGVNVNDPALSSVLDNNTSLEGNAGIAYHIGNLNLGFALPRLFNTATYATESFDTGEFDALSNYILTANYMVYFGMGSHVFEPYLLYRSYQGYESQFEAGAIFQFNDLFWVGGNYRQNYGYAGLVGLKLKSSLSIGYAYEVPANKVSGVNTVTHEIQISFSLGKKNKRSEKHSTFLASEQVVKPKKEKKEDPPIVAVVPEVEEKVEEPVIEEPIVEEEIVEEEIIEEEIKDPDPDPQPEVKDDVTSPPPPVDDQNKVQENKPISNQPVETNPTSPTGNKPAVVAARGNHPFELDAGNYVVVGAFAVMQSAIRMSDQLVSQGHKPGIGYNSEKKLFYVYMYEGENATETRNQRDQIRENEQFKDAWYLQVTDEGIVTTPGAQTTTDLKKPEPESVSQQPTGKPAVVLKQGYHPFELDKGHYVIVGAFSVMENAIRLSDQLITQGFKPGIGYNSEKKLFYIHMYKGKDSVTARNERNKLMQVPQFKKAWYLVVQ